MSPSSHISYNIPDVMAVDYIVEGDRTANAVACGESQIRGIWLGTWGQEPLIEERDVAAVRNIVNAIGTVPRVYNDAIFARTVERVYDLTRSDQFDDVHVMARLLELAGEEHVVGPAGESEGDHGAAHGSY